MVEKKSELSVMKWPRNQFLNVVATLRQRLDKVEQRRCHNVGDRHLHNFHFRLLYYVVTTSITTLWQRCHNVDVPAGFVCRKWSLQNVISNNKDSEASRNTTSIYPGQDCDIASTGILTGILVCT